MRARDTIDGLALCAGYGGLELGVQLALGSYRVVCYAEGGLYPASLLRARMEVAEALGVAPIWDDVRTFDGGPWRGVVDLVTAGYPCKPFSLAGKQKGEADPRHLWPHIRRVWAECEAPLLFCENVPNHLSLGFSQVLDDLEAVGARTACILARAADVGAPHRRERMFFLAMAHGDSGRRAVERARYDIHRHHARGHIVDGCGAHLPDPDGERLRQLTERRESDATECGDAQYGDTRSPWPPGPEAGQAEWETWIAEGGAEPVLRGGSYGPPFRVDQLRACGNGVVPVVAAAAFSALVEALYEDQVLGS